MIKLQRKGIFKENTYQTILLETDSEQKTIRITQEYFKTQEINEINMTYDECVKMEELVKKCVNDSLKKQRGLENSNVFYGTYNPALEDDERRIVTVVNSANRSLSIQIINKYVVNLIDTLKNENKTSVLKINLKELQRMFIKLDLFLYKNNYKIKR
ncbi:hypothetical protein NKR74_14590 [Bacillus sp. 3103sda1]|uniref:hypothetical protein n=1 Tax=Bacillus sp. 3103sda1 TaxID=2953808 RepID=UPI00209CBFBA|nr:hypothetical protein [Bacillus sp. 3103sda1]MCP1124516.1 hypothetical protein [Bacillus sp. 3103sda1]